MIFHTKLRSHSSSLFTSIISNNKFISKTSIKFAFLSTSTKQKITPFNTLSTERQEGVILYGLQSTECIASQIVEKFNKKGINIDEEDVFCMHSRLGRFMNRILINTNQKIDDLTLEHFSDSTRYHPVDYHDACIFIEQCERYEKFADDLRWMSQWRYFDKIVSISEVPNTYGRSELSAVIREHTNVDVPPENIVFRFTKAGIQASVAWAVCSSKRDADQLINTLQEVAIPRRYQYGRISGAAFIYAGRQNLFVSDSELDFQLESSKFQIFTCGWHGDVSEDEFRSLLAELKFWPLRIKKICNTADNTSSFFMEFDRMKDTKKFMYRFNTLKHRWQIPKHEIFYAYPRMADVHWVDETKYEDEAADSDLDESIDY